MNGEGKQVLPHCCPTRLGEERKDEQQDLEKR